MLRDWLPEDHLAWFVIDAVRSMDLAAFYGAYRADGHGRAAYEPSMMVTLLMYAFATGHAVLAGDRASLPPGRRVQGDHRQRGARSRDVARFVVRHEAALADLFGEVLRLCDRAGLVKPGVDRDRRDTVAGEREPGGQP